ncbi:unnamed protein product [Allacma fusca]|uniref:Ig-like domain-containing protein n=1 Tax=Allacma fusca TaxID=39272 RepID=A0A8J2JVR3_9HEXA|nr:unnamed protein product [Allacma fusca]
MDRDEEISVKAGDKAILQCKARGDLPIEIQWAHKHIKITSHSSSRYTIRHQNLEAGILSELLISDASRSDGGVYNCRAANSFGSDQTLVMLKVQGMSIDILSSVVYTLT